jgi:hypothetical protein
LKFKWKHWSPVDVVLANVTVTLAHGPDILPLHCPIMSMLAQQWAVKAMAWSAAEWSIKSQKH